MRKVTFTRYEIYYKLALAFSTLVIISCTFTTSRINQKEDQHMAVKSINQFYDQLKKNDFANTLSFYSDTFKRKLDTTTLYSFYRSYYTRIGGIKSVDLLNCQTLASNNNGHLFKTFVITYNVHRTKGKTKERFILKSYDDESPKISRYDILENAIKN